MNSAHVGDTGTILQKIVTDNGVVVDISSAIVKNLIIIDAAGVCSILAGSFETDGTDGILNFVSTLGTWTRRGIASEQVQLTMPSGSWSSDIFSRRIEDKLIC